MNGDLTKAQHYRDLGRQMRNLAAQEKNEDAKQNLIQLAERYEALCHGLIDRTERSQ